MDFTRAFFVPERGRRGRKCVLLTVFLKRWYIRYYVVFYFMEVNGVSTQKSSKILEVSG